MQEDAAGGRDWLKRAVVGRDPKRTLLRILALVIITIIVIRYLVVPIRVAGISMSPNYQDGQIRLVYRLAYLREKPGRGDVVAIRMAGDRAMLMKRVVGLPGDKVSIRNGFVYIDGELLQEPYVKLPRSPDWHGVEEKHLGPGEYFLIGDNRSMDKQAHHFGMANEHQIVGRVLF
jgi:signal peptidase I